MPFDQIRNGVSYASCHSGAPFVWVRNYSVVSIPVAIMTLNR